MRTVHGVHACSISRAQSRATVLVLREIANNTAVVSGDKKVKRFRMQLYPAVGRGPGLAGKRYVHLQQTIRVLYVYLPAIRGEPRGLSCSFLVEEEYGDLRGHAGRLLLGSRAFQAI